MIAVSWKTAQYYGCPHCGFHTGIEPDSEDARVSTHWTCPSCQESFITLGEGETRSAFGIPELDQMVHPCLQAHPRAGRPAHDGGGPKQPEYFDAQGLSVDMTPGCFVCGGPHDIRTSLRGTARSRASAERITLEMFGGRGAWLDLGDLSPPEVAVRIGACVRHEPLLEKLLERTRRDGEITPDLIIEVRRIAG